MRLLVILLLPFIGSLGAAFLPRSARNLAVWLSGSIALASAVLTASLYPRIAAGDVLHLSAAWAPAIGLDLHLRVDGYAWLFAMLVTVMGVLVVLYARYYMAAADPVPRFFSFLLAFMGAMLGVVLSGNLIQLVVFWELTSLTSFMLIAYWYHREDARRGARMALIVTAGGGFCLLLGVLMLGTIVGSYDLDAVLAAGDTIRAPPVVRPDAAADPGGRTHQERPVSVPLLAAAGHGGSDASFGVPAFGHHGEGGRVPARATVAGVARAPICGSGSSPEPAARRCWSAPSRRPSSAI